MSIDSHSLDIATWFERRIDSSLGFHLPAARLYGVVVNDPFGLTVDEAGAARSSFIGEHRDVYSMLTGAPGVLARSFDAAAAVTTGWAAPMLGDGSMAHRPSRHPERRRIRAVSVVSDHGVASLIRFEDDPAHLVQLGERGTGDMVDALEVMWFGDPTDLVNVRTTRGGCTRHP